MPTLAQTFPYVALAHQYAEDVATDKVLACRWTRLACERYLRDLETHQPKSTELYFDVEKANRICDVVQHFPHIKGQWAKTHRRLVLEPWQCFILANVFGWMQTESDTRRFRVVYIEVPRKNAKSTLSSAVGLYLLACDGEPGALVVSAANTRDQAKLLFSDAQLMAKRERGYRDHFGVEVLAHAIVQESTASRFQALAAEYSNLDGLNIHGALVDELHAHNTRGVWDVLETAIGARRQPLMWAITTAGQNRESVCFDQRRHVTRMLEGELKDDSYFGIIYTIDEGDDPWAEESWRKANPNYGVSIYPENLKPLAARAQTMPSAQTAFFTKHLNIWVNADQAWLPSGAWMRCADHELALEDFEGQVCYIGIDLALRSDIAAVVLLFPPTDERNFYACFGRYYLPQEVIERSENSHYQGWVSEGQLIETEGAVTDWDYILDSFDDFSGRFDIREFASDPWKNAPLVNAMEKRGITVPIVNVRQSPSMTTPAMLEMEGLVLEKRIRHNGDPVLAWMVSNVVAHRLGQQGMQPQKRSPELKIDGVTALLIALDRAMKNSTYTGQVVWGLSKN